MKQTIKNKKGFTLVELVVVLVIIGIFAVIAIPSFTAYLRKQKESDAKSECKLIVASSQSAYMELYAKNRLTSVGADKKQILKMAGTGGSFQGSIFFDENEMKIQTLTYKAENGLCVKYNKDADVKYVISDDSALTPLEEYVEEYKKLMDQLYKEGKVNNWASRELLMKYMYDHGNGYMPVDSSFLKSKYFDELEDQLYWQPYYLSSKGVSGSFGSLLIATKSDGSNPNNMHGQWKAYLVYYDGKIYETGKTTTNGAGTHPEYIGVSSLATIKNPDDVHDFLISLGFRVQS